jgi:nucleoside-diphosphate-sugar epimerase
MRVLVTGASGFIGAHTVRALAHAGHDLRLLARPTSDLSTLTDVDYELAVGDLDGAGLTDAVNGVDAVVHVAGLVAARTDADFHRVNARGTGLLAAAASDANVARFLLVSSLAARGPSLNGAPPDPEGRRQPVTPYGESKAAGEVEALAQAGDTAGGMAVEILRPPAVYGPGDTGLLPFFQMARRHYVTRLGDGRNRIDMIYGPDCAEAIVALLARKPGARNIFHISDRTGPYDWRQLIDALAVAYGHRIVTIPIPGIAFEIGAHLSVAYSRLRRNTPLLDYSRVAEMRQPAWLSDHAALTEHTSWTPQTDLTDGLRLTLDWYREHSWL